MRTNRTRALLAAVAVVGGITAGVGSASATALSFTISPTSGPAGTVVTFTGSGCPHVADHLTDGTFELFAGIDTNHGGLLARVRFLSNANGSFGGSTDPLPAAGLGNHRTDVACDNGNIVPGADFVMTPGDPPPTIAPVPTVIYRFAPAAGPAGTTVDVLGAGCPPGQHTGAADSIDGRLHIWKGLNTAEGPFMVLKAFLALDTSGRFHFTFTVPSATDIPLGDHISEIVCTGGQARGQVFTLTASAPTTTGVSTTSSSSTTSTSSTTTTTRPPSPGATVVDQLRTLVDSMNLPPEAAATLNFILRLLLRLLG